MFWGWTPYFEGIKEQNRQWALEFLILQANFLEENNRLKAITEAIKEKNKFLDSQAVGELVKKLTKFIYEIDVIVSFLSSVKSDVLSCELQLRGF